MYYKRGTQHIVEKVWVLGTQLLTSLAFRAGKVMQSRVAFLQTPFCREYFLKNKSKKSPNLRIFHLHIGEQLCIF